MEESELSRTFINKIPQADAIKHFIIKTLWQTNEINLHIIDTSCLKEWEGILYPDKLRRSADELEIPYKEFFDECKEALTRNGGIEDFQYLMEHNKFTLIKNDEFEIQYITVNMRPINVANHTMTETAVDLIASLRIQLSAIREESNKLNAKCQTMVTTLGKCLDEKDFFEDRLMRKFSVLLNSKKDKIAELQALLVEKNIKFDDAGISGIESHKRKPSEMAGTSKNNDVDFIAATQLMNKPVVNLPKRMKFQAAEELPNKGSLAKETATSSEIAPDTEPTNKIDLFEMFSRA